MNINTFSLGVIVIALSACAGLDDYDPLSEDRARCGAQGFADGSSAMARCMDTASNERIARERREMEEFEGMMALEAKREAEKKAEKKKKQHHDAAAQNSEGTFRGATGADPALANLSMCSDGKLREDCSFAPLGY